MQKQLIDVDNVEGTRSRRNTDTIGDFYIAQFKLQIQLLEDQKEAALSKQTELTFALQKNKSQLASEEEKFKKEKLKLESEILALKDENESLKYAQNLQIIGRSSANKVVKLENHENKTRMCNLLNNFRELKSRKDEAENNLKEYEIQFYQKMILNENESNYIKDLKKNLESQEKLAGSLKVQIQIKDKEIEERTKSYESLNREANTLRKQIKLFTESEFSDPITTLLQEQVISYEKEFQSLSLELKTERSKYSEQIKGLLDQLVAVKTTIQESEEYYVNQINKLVVEKDALQRRLNENPFSSPRKSVSEFAHSVQEENYNQTLQFITLELNDLRTSLNLLQEKNFAQEKKIEKYKSQINTQHEEKKKLKKKLKESQEQLKSLSIKLTNYEVNLFEINDKLAESQNRIRELEIEIERVNNDG